MWSPNGGAKYYKRYSFARLPGEGFLFCEEKEPKVTRGGPRDPLTLKLRLDTNDVNIVRTAPQIRSQGVCGAFLCRDCR